MGNDKINQLLRDRKAKNRKVAHYRKQRIIKHYNKTKEEVTANDQVHHDEADKRKINFYQQVFNGPAPVKKNKAEKVQHVPEVNQSEQKLQKLKHKKKHFIKKMNQKTSKGQPLMRNYIKYALTKLEQTLEKQKIAKNQPTSK